MKIGQSSPWVWGPYVIKINLDKNFDGVIEYRMSNVIGYHSLFVFTIFQLNLEGLVVTWQKQSSTGEWTRLVHLLKRAFCQLNRGHFSGQR